MRRRELLFGGGALAAGMALTGCGSGGEAGAPGDAPAAEDWRSEVTGGPIEVGVLTAQDTPGLAYLEQLATTLESEIEGAEIKLTF
ncbi:MAG TPA: hypothetical protein VK020_11005, partial [Microlunatus sp.]|nr:hypothetical protein [Microlunatus sp.]